MLIGQTGLITTSNQISQMGYQAAHQLSKETASVSEVSNFGSETKVGSSKFIQANEQAAQYGQQATAENAHETTQTFEQFENKQAYTKNATLEAIRQSTMDISG
ncbi:MAG: hypothetical protein IJS96_07350 [Schwartzia sp.]|nr:hypothetical protein [Schwartzia sp. (in: firmicutes)]